jgi:hypothetical protein
MLPERSTSKRSKRPRQAERKPQRPLVGGVRELVRIREEVGGKE